MQIRSVIDELNTNPNSDDKYSGRVRSVNEQRDSVYRIGQHIVVDGTVWVVSQSEPAEQYYKRIGY